MNNFSETFLNRLGSVLKTLKRIDGDAVVTSAVQSTASPYEYIVRSKNYFGLESIAMVNLYGLATDLRENGKPDVADLWLETVNELQLSR